MLSQVINHRLIFRRSLFEFYFLIIIRIINFPNTAYEVLVDEQHRFRPGMSTTRRIFTFYVINVFRQHHSRVDDVIDTNYSKVFDCVDHVLYCLIYNQIVQLCGEPILS